MKEDFLTGCVFFLKGIKEYSKKTIEEYIRNQGKEEDVLQGTYRLCYIF